MSPVVLIGLLNRNIFRVIVSFWKVTSYPCLCCGIFFPDMQKLEREARICRLLKHPNIGNSMLIISYQFMLIHLFSDYIIIVAICTIIIIVSFIVAESNDKTPAVKITDIPFDRSCRP